MNTILWIIQIILALMFALHGWVMLTTTTTPPRPEMGYIVDIPTRFRRLIGVAEILAALGLVLPALTGILPALTPLAAAGLVIVMAGAAVFHIPRKEYGGVVFNLILLALAAFVAYGRFAAVPL